MPIPFRRFSRQQHGRRSRILLYALIEYIMPNATYISDYMPSPSLVLRHATIPYLLARVSDCNAVLL